MGKEKALGRKNEENEKKGKERSASPEINEREREHVLPYHSSTPLIASPLRRRGGAINFV